MQIKSLFENNQWKKKTRTFGDRFCGGEKSLNHCKEGSGISFEAYGVTGGLCICMCCSVCAFTQAALERTGGLSNEAEGVIVQEGKGHPRRRDQWLCCPSARASESCHSDPALTLNIPSLGMPLLAWHPISCSACPAEIRGTQAFDSRHHRRLPSAEETDNFQLQ